MLLALVVITVAGILIGIIKFQINPFVVLIAASVFLGLTSGMDPQVLVKSITAGMGGTLGFIGIVLGFGTMMGKLLAESGAADVLARGMIAILGERRVNWAIAIVSFIVGISVFFQVGIVLLIPLLFTIVRRTGVSLTFVVVPLLASLTTVQHYMPPHPAVMAIVPLLHADISRVLVYGILISIPCAFFAGPIYGNYLSRRLKKIPTEEMMDKFCSVKVHDNPPGFFTSIFTMLLPIVLMLLSELAEVLLPKGTDSYKILKFFGEPSIALFLSFLFSLYTFGFARGFDKKTLSNFTSQCLGPVASILLIIGAGGAFSKILVDSGVAKAVSALAVNWHIPPLFFAWFVATMLRITVGSGSVSMITTAGLVAPMVQAGTITPELMVMAIGAGGTGFSHVTDSGFWVVKEFFNLSIQETLRVWTVCSTIVSLLGLFMVCALHAAGY